MEVLWARVTELTSVAWAVVTGPWMWHCISSGWAHICPYTPPASEHPSLPSHQPTPFRAVSHSSELPDLVSLSFTPEPSLGPEWGLSLWSPRFPKLIICRTGHILVPSTPASHPLPYFKSRHVIFLILKSLKSAHALPWMMSQNCCCPADVLLTLTFGYKNSVLNVHIVEEF